MKRFTPYRNKLRFPQLWANYKDDFNSFFDHTGHMNTNGHRAYDRLKQKRRMRMCYKKS
jgi:hypothetical protein